MQSEMFATYDFHVLRTSGSGFVFEEIAPGFIRPGLMVELQVSVCTIPLRHKGGANLPLIKLRSVCVLSRAVEQVSW